MFFVERKRILGVETTVEVIGTAHAITHVRLSRLVAITPCSRGEQFLWVVIVDR